MDVDSVRGVVEAAIQRASNATGVDFSFLLGTAKRESGYNPGAHAPTSSAAGLFQFVEQAWLQVRLRPLRRPHPEEPRRALFRAGRRGQARGHGPAAGSARRLADGG